MPTIQRVYCWDVASAIQAFIFQVKQVGGGEGTPFDPPDVIIVEGYKAFHTVVPSLGDYHIQVVVQTIAEGQDVPCRYLLSIPGIQRVRAEMFGDGFEDWYTWEGRKAGWEDLDVAVAVLALEEMGGGSVSEPEYHEISGAADSVRSVCCVLKVTTDVECMAVTLTLNGALDVDEIGANYGVETPAVISGVGNASSDQSSSALAAIAQGIQDLAHKTTAVSLNNGGAIAVVDSSEVIVP